MVLAVFPGAEPQEHKAEVVLACLVDEEVHVAKVECPFRWLNLLPVDRCFDCVGVHGFGGAPGGGQGRRPGAGVVDLAAKQEERLSVDNKSEAIVALLKMGDIVGLGFRLGVERGEYKGTQNELLHGPSNSL